MSGAGVRRLQVAVGGGVSVAVSDYQPAAVEHTVVFIHGFCLNRGAWVDQGRRVMARYPGRVRVIRFDLRGHGQSSAAPMDTYTIYHCAGDLAELLDVLSVDGPMTIVGHSMGGMIALSYLARPAQDRPVDPAGLVLIATAAGHLTRCGMGRLLDSPATDAVFDMVRHSPAHVLAAPLGSTARQMSIAGRRSPGWAAVAAVAASALFEYPGDHGRGIFAQSASFRPIFPAGIDLRAGGGDQRRRRCADPSAADSGSGRPNSGLPPCLRTGRRAHDRPAGPPAGSGHDRRDHRGRQSAVKQISPAVQRAGGCSVTAAVRIADTVFRPKTSTEWGQIVDSYYAARGEDGMVVHPNWVIYLPNKTGKPGVRVIVDVIPADPEEIAAAQTDRAPAGLLEVADKAAQTGRGFKVLACLLDVTGCYTAAFIERCNTTPALQRREGGSPAAGDAAQRALWEPERRCRSTPFNAPTRVKSVAPTLEGGLSTRTFHP